MRKEIEHKQSTIDKYKLVVDEWFVNGFNGTQAYLKYYPDVNEKTAGVEANRILAIPKMEDYVTKKKVRAQVLLDTSHKKVLEELRNWAYSDITETISLSPKEVKELPKEFRRLITKFKHTVVTTKDGTNYDTVELHFVSKEKAMEMIQKHIGFYEIDNEQKSMATTIDNVNINFKKKR